MTALLRKDGPGLPAVLLHGIGSDAPTWQGVMDRLPHAIAWDAPGYGASPPVAAARPTPEDYARRLAELDLPRAVVVGHSLGCLFAARYALRHPDRVAALVLLSPALGYAVPPGAALPEAVQARIDDLDTLGPAAFAEKRAPRLVARMEALPGVRRAMAAVNPEGYAQAVHALGAGDLLADAALLGLPVLVGVGDADVVTPPANAQRLHAGLRHPIGPARLIPGSGHALPQEDPAATAALVMEALRHGG